ncbi:twin-arginine translocase TatA/TatE family subunit [Actinomyces sp. HMT897]|uniref:twin-arginine translocase TatA/TatE family subunit n=1 Tax=Actinomyces sp. HMT897 TaxID=2789424 RepID=UPI00190CBD63|nr:twin-arginine translocase TatA/TatE family subunit [Actinomyces sp. HMT897]QQO78371.1 twin-arginine translocase TatA/TatE family subunit [Actinomyces sp. HMT897]
MFGINGNEFIVILLVAVIVVGPRRLPEYTRKLTQLIRQLRVFLEQAKAQIAEEVGPELGDLNLADLNPRNYDPRKIVRDALGEDLDAIKRDLANPLAAVASTAKEASDAVAADVRALAAQERSDSLGKRIEAQAEAARAGAEAEAAQGSGSEAEAAGATSSQVKEAQGTGAESAQAGAGVEAAQVAEAKSEETRAEAADTVRGPEPGAGEEPMSDTTSQAGSAETASAPQAEVSQEQDTTPDDQEQTAAQPVVQGRDTAPGEQRPDVLQEQQDATPGEQRAAAPDDQEQDAVVTGSRDGQTATSEAAAIPTSLTEASGDLPPRPLSPRDIVRAAKAAARTRPEAATLTVDA